MVEIDCLGQRCPLPVIALAKAVKKGQIGDVFRIEADDPAAANDIAAWCRMQEQEFVGNVGPDAYEVRKVR